MSSIRASAMQQIIGSLESSTAPEHARVLSRLGPELIDTVRSTPRLDWIDLELNLEMVRAIAAELGPEGGEDFFHQVYAVMLQGPFLGALFRGIRALGADNPASYLKHAPRAYPMIFRDTGTVSLGERGETSVEMQYEQLPPQVFEDETPWVRFAAASYRCVFDFSGKPGSTRVIASDPGAGRCTILFDWTPPG